VAILRRAALQDIGNENLRALQANLLQQTVEELARCSHKGAPLFILVIPRGLTHKYDVGFRGPTPADDLRPASRQGTLLAILNRLMERLQSIVHISHRSSPVRARE